jgi:hypothetical protein
MRLAIGHAALAAPAGLFLGLGIGEFAIDLVEILGSGCRIAFLGHLAPKVDEFEHLLRGHGCASFANEGVQSLIGQGACNEKSVRLTYLTIFRAARAFATA